MTETNDGNHIPHLDKSRQIARRIVVTGVLMLETPAHFGNGDADGVTDLSLIRDPLQGKALLTGATIAGALRNYLWEREMGYRCRYDQNTKAHKTAMAIRLFGGAQSDPDGKQSALIVEDALGEYPITELRDGVRIDPKRRTAADQMKYDVELLRAGTTFPLRFELLVAENQDCGVLKRALAIALSGLEEAGEICLGSRKRRGYGECSVTEWAVTEYDLTTGEGLLDWLDEVGISKTGAKIAKLLGVADKDHQLSDSRHALRIKADFRLDGSLLVRSGIGEEIRSDSGEVVGGPDAMHIHRLEKNGSHIPVLPGTSIAGSLRHRALRIAQLFHHGDGHKLINHLFGSDPGHKPDNQKAEQVTAEATAGQFTSGQPTAEGYTGSKLSVRETVIQNAHTLIQHRIRIDRLTGGVLDNYLFDEAPLFGGADALVQLDLTVRNPTEKEVGLLLLLLKDLWTADLALGGGLNIGRGRLHGLRAECRLQGGTPDHESPEPETWELQHSGSSKRGDSLQVTTHAQERMEMFVRALREPLSDNEAPAIASSPKNDGKEVDHA